MELSATEINGFAICKNEASRYLQSCLKWHEPFLNSLFVFDDHSEDNSVEIAQDHAYVVENTGISFMEHEGRFRQAAYEAWERAIQPEEGSWVFAMDLDEFLVGPVQDQSPLYKLQQIIKEATRLGKDSIKIHKPEIWNVTKDGLYTRTDGYWVSDFPVRLFRYKKNGLYMDKVMGCGSCPTYVKNALDTSVTIRLLHFGYALQQDRQERYDRYTSLTSHGHNEKHIQSILKAPTLTRYYGQVPDWYRGVR